MLQLLGEEKETRCFNEFGQIFMILTYAAVALSGQLMYRKGFFIVTFVWVSVVIMAGIMRWKMIAAFEALRSEFRSAGAEGISLALVGFAISFFIAEKIASMKIRISW